MSVTNRAWRCYERRPAAHTRLFCFPHAGAAASAFRPWAALLPPNLELHVAQHPGREDRWTEPPRTSVADVVADLLPGLRDLAGQPFALFGHSLGATIAYETALALRDLGHRPAPEHLFVSGKEAPQHHTRRVFHTAPDEVLTAEVVRVGGEHASALYRPEVRDYALPTLRADYMVDETYEPDLTRAPLDQPITAITGSHDPELTPVQAHGWAAHTRGRFTARFVPGGHFAVLDSPADIISVITSALARTPSGSDISRGG